jgi:NIPSNAP
MPSRRTLFALYSVVLLALGALLGRAADDRSAVAAQAGPKVYELRTYTAPPGKLDALHARFRDHTLRIFQKHGITNVAYFRPTDAPASEQQLVYLLAYPSRDAAKTSWDAFRNDPEWKTVASESQKDGPIVAKVDSVFMTATDYSPMK